jgi:hypothetical protein
LCEDKCVKTLFDNVDSVMCNKCKATDSKGAEVVTTSQNECMLKSEYTALLRTDKSANPCTLIGCNECYTYQYHSTKFVSAIVPK